MEHAKQEPTLLKKIKNRRTGKRAAVNDTDSRRESEEEEEEIWEEESPKQQNQDRPQYSRTARLNFGQPAYRNLNEQLSNMSEEERKNLTIRGSARRVNIAKQDEDAVIPSTAHSEMVGGRCTHTDCVMDSG